MSINQCPNVLFQVGKMAAATVGGSLILLQIAHHKGYIKVDWNKVRPFVNMLVGLYIAFLFTNLNELGFSDGPRFLHRGRPRQGQAQDAKQAGLPDWES